jgi:hypothetical protein
MAGSGGSCGGGYLHKDNRFILELYLYGIVIMKQVIQELFRQPVFEKPLDCAAKRAGAE